MIVAQVGSLAQQLAEAQDAVVASEPARAERTTLEAFRSKLEGKAAGIARLRGAAAAGRDLAAEIDSYLSQTRLTHLRLSMKTADLRLMLMRHEKAQANMHCSGGALVCVKRIQRRIALEPTKPSGLTMRKLEPPPELPAAGGTLTKEMRSFIRGAFGPLIRAALRQLLLQQPPDPFTFLADFFWQVSPARYNPVAAACNGGNRQHPCTFLAILSSGSACHRAAPPQPPPSPSPNPNPNLAALVVAPLRPHLVRA